MTSVALMSTPQVVGSTSTQPGVGAGASATSASNDSSIESKLEKLNLKLMQNKLFQSNRTYFLRMSPHIVSYHRPTNESTSWSSSSSISASSSTSSSWTRAMSICADTINKKSSIITSNSESSSNSGELKTKTKKVVRFADTLGFQLVTIWCVGYKTTASSNSKPVKLRRLASNEDSEEDSASSSSLDDEDAISSNDEDDFNRMKERSMFMENTVGWMRRYCVGGSGSGRCSSSSSNSHRNETSYHYQHKIPTNTPVNGSIAPVINSTKSTQTSQPACELPIKETTVTESECATAGKNSDGSLTTFVADTFVFDNLMFTWRCLFEQPGISPDFYTRLNANKVLLESIYSSNMRLNGVVRVLNLAYVKRVFVRYTINNWQSQADLDCQYLSSIGTDQDKLTDRFVFTVCLEKSQVIACIDDMNKLNRSPQLKLEFAVCFILGGGNNDVLVTSSMPSYWDNNRGLNYQYDCDFKIATSPSSSSSSSSSSSQRNLIKTSPLIDHHNHHHHHHHHRHNHHKINTSMTDHHANISVNGISTNL